MTSDELTNAFITAGLDTPTKVIDALAQSVKNARLKEIDNALDALQLKQVDAMAPINNERITLVNERNALLANFAKK